MQREWNKPGCALIQEYCIHRDDFNTFGGNRHALDDFSRLLHRLLLPCTTLLSTDLTSFPYNTALSM